MNLRVDGAYIYFTVPLFGGIPITQTALSSLLVTLILCAASIYLGKNLRKYPGALQALAERGVISLQNMVCSTMGAHNVHRTPFIATIFLSSLLGSAMGLTGFLRPSTADLSCTLVWALMVTGMIWYNAIRHRGFSGWLKGFTEPIAVMTPMNLISEIAQPVSMAFRHFGSLAGGGVITALIYGALSLASSKVLQWIARESLLPSLILILFGIFPRRKRHSLLFRILCPASLLTGISGFLHATGLLPGIPFLALGIPAVLSVYFDLFSGFVQAYVFTLLTMVYLTNSLPNPQI